MIEWNELITRLLREQHDSSSHTELEPYRFHPSQLGHCKRNAYVSKLGLTLHDPPTIGTFRMGHLVHEWLEESLADRDDVVMEMPLEEEVNGVELVGHCDCYEITPADMEDRIHDFKTKSTFYFHDPPIHYHGDQVTLYMAMSGAREAKIVYLSKKNFYDERDEIDEPYRITTWPEEEDSFIQFDPMRVNDLTEKAKEVGRPIERDGLPSGPEDIPFEKCGCWVCEQEQLDPRAFYE